MLFTITLEMLRKAFYRVTAYIKHDWHVQGYFCSHLLPTELCRELTIRIPTFYFRAASCHRAAAYMTCFPQGTFDHLYSS